MAFEPRVFEQILADMVAYVRANTRITDFNVGSVIRTFLEAAALEDDEQYHQMVQLLSAFSFSTATGTDLDERAADFNLSRLLAAQAVGKVRITDEALTTSALTYDAAAGAVAITLNDVSEFPITGFPYNVRVGEGLSMVEDVAVASLNTVTGVFVVAALANSHDEGERVSEVAGAQQSVASGTQVQVPAIGDGQPISYQSTEAAVIALGDYQSNLVSIISNQGGIFGNVGVGRISEFTGGVPFVGASVTNPSSTGGGRDEETDRAFRDRIKLRIQALGRGTPKSIEGGVVGAEDPITGQRVVTAKLQENFTTEEHLLYIDDGTGFTPDTVILAASALAGGVVVGAATLTLVDGSDYPASGTVLIMSGTPDTSEVLEYTSKTGNVLNLTLTATATHTIADAVFLVDDIGWAEEGQNFFRTNNYPARRNSIRLFDDS
ncbi:MAG: hypothetical protein DRP42_07290, partial [Tenericutes bacterium]